MARTCDVLHWQTLKPTHPIPSTLVPVTIMFFLLQKINKQTNITYRTPKKSNWFEFQGLKFPATAGKYIINEGYVIYQIH
jgi:hypothetical protein